MCRLISHQEAKLLLSADNVSSFWRESGNIQSLPDHFRFLFFDHVGLFVFEPFYDYVGIHPAIFPEVRGKIAVKAGREAIQWAFDKLDAYKVVARIQRDRKEVILFSKWSGMVEYDTDDTHYYCEASRCQ